MATSCSEKGEAGTRMMYGVAVVFASSLYHVSSSPNEYAQPSSSRAWAGCQFRMDSRGYRRLWHGLEVKQQ